MRLAIAIAVASILSLVAAPSWAEEEDFKYDEDYKEEWKDAAPATHTRRKIWEFDTNLHCSIIGTCLTTAELRQALGKAGLKPLFELSDVLFEISQYRRLGIPRGNQHLTF